MTLLLSAKNQHPEIFYTLQGEGQSLGKPAIFIRFAGCNLHCFWCDTDYTWNWQGTAFAHQKEADPTYEKVSRKERTQSLSAEAIAKLLYPIDCQHLVITGGEPLLQDAGLLQLLSHLNQAQSYSAEIETNGTIFPSEDLLALVSQVNVSPKLSGSRNEPSKALVAPVLHQFAALEKAYFKFVISHQQDLDEVLALVATYRLDPSRVFLMPNAIDVAALTQNSPWVSAQCLKHGFRFGDRLHLRLGLA